jgi:hypothetical protein
VSLRERFSRWIADGKAFCQLFGLLVVSAEDDAGKDASLANYRLYAALLTEQRDVARRELAVYQAQLGADLSELCDDRDDWKHKAEFHEKRADALSGALKGILAVVLEGGACSVCGHRVDHPLHGDRCPTRMAVEAIGEFATPAGDA